MSIECALGLLTIVIALGVVLGGLIVVVTGWMWWEYNRNEDEQNQTSTAGTPGRIDPSATQNHVS